VPSALKKSVEAPDERQAILDKLGDLSEVQIAQNEVLVAIYVRPETSAGGIVLTPNYRKEDIYQGKVGLVVKIGSACRFVRTNEKTGVTYGVPIELHDWIVTRPSDTWPLDVNGGDETYDAKNFVTCRLVFDDQIRMKIPFPGMIW
jgi:hypothetical protein